MQVEDSCGAALAFDHPVGLKQDRFDVTSLHVGQRAGNGLRPSVCGLGGLESLRFSLLAWAVTEWWCEVQVRRQSQCVALGQHDSAFNDVLQFTDIARPVIACQPTHSLLRNLAYRLAVFLRKLLDEKRSQKRHIALAFAQWGHAERQNVEAII